MASNLTLNCIYERTRNNNTGFCECFVPFYGSQCEQTYSYWETVNWIHAVVFSIAFLGLAVWTVGKIADLRKKDRFSMKKLSNIVLVLLLISFIMRLFQLYFSHMDLYLWRSDTYTMTQHVIDKTATFVKILPVAFWMACTTLILGFWFDVLKKKLLPRMARTTRIVCIASACLVLLAIPGLIMSALPGLSTAGIAVSFFPFIVDVIVLIVITVLIVRGKTKQDLSVVNADRRDYALRRLIGLDVLWILYILLKAGETFLRGGYYPFKFSVSLCEVLMCSLLLRLVDRPLNGLNIIFSGLAGRDIRIFDTSSEETATKSSASKMRTTSNKINSTNRSTASSKTTESNVNISSDKNDNGDDDDDETSTSASTPTKDEQSISSQESV